MTMINSWKQPIPVEIPSLKGDLFAITVFQKLLIRCSNNPRTTYVGDIPIELLRGQCIVGRNELAKCFGLKQKESSRIRRILNKLQNTAKLITKRKSLNCSIVTILNYDDWVGMTEQTTKRTPNVDQTTATNKKAKSEKNKKLSSSKITGWTPEAFKIAEEIGRGINQ